MKVVRFIGSLSSLSNTVLAEAIVALVGAMVIAAGDRIPYGTLAVIALAFVALTPLSAEVTYRLLSAGLRRGAARRTARRTARHEAARTKRLARIAQRAKGK